MRKAGRTTMRAISAGGPIDGVDVVSKPNHRAGDLISVQYRYEAR
jgi:hypothetical protein